MLSKTKQNKKTRAVWSFLTDFRGSLVWGSEFLDIDLCFQTAHALKWCLKPQQHPEVDYYVTHYAFITRNEWHIVNVFAFPFYFKDRYQSNTWVHRYTFESANLPTVNTDSSISSESSLFYKIRVGLIFYIKYRLSRKSDLDKHRVKNSHRPSGILRFPTVPTLMGDLDYTQLQHSAWSRPTSWLWGHLGSEQVDQALFNFLVLSFSLLLK